MRKNLSLSSRCSCKSLAMAILIRDLAWSGTGAGRYFLYRNTSKNHSGKGTEQEGIQVFRKRIPFRFLVDFHAGIHNGCTTEIALVSLWSNSTLKQRFDQFSPLEYNFKGDTSIKIRININRKGFNCILIHVMRSTLKQRSRFWLIRKPFSACHLFTFLFCTVLFFSMAAYQTVHQMQTQIRKQKKTERTSFLLLIGVGFHPQKSPWFHGRHSSRPIYVTPSIETYQFSQGWSRIQEIIDQCLKINVKLITRNQPMLIDWVVWFGLSATLDVVPVAFCTAALGRHWAKHLQTLIYKLWRKFTTQPKSWANIGFVYGIRFLSLPDSGTVSTTETIPASIDDSVTESVTESKVFRNGRLFPVLPKESGMISGPGK